MSLALTIDDFDPLIAYSNYADWSTPDPSLNPSFWNARGEVTGVAWHEGESVGRQLILSKSFKGE
jgi:hypothetical protein